MKAALRILSAGPGTAIQDGGRHGYLRYGVTSAGPMDPVSHATANMAVGARVDAAALEVSVGGVALTTDRPVVLAVVAAGFAVSVDRTVLPSNTTFQLLPGQVLAIRPGDRGSWGYVAIDGEIALPKALGSLSTHTRSHLGGFQGRALQAGDTLPVTMRKKAGEWETRVIKAPWLGFSPGIIRVIAGPQHDYFSGEQQAIFETSPWKVSGRSDRMAYQLEGPKLVHLRGFNIVSDGVALGAIQVPGDGQPIVLMADRQPTGGYPKIANVIGADIGRLAQARPGDILRFGFVSVADAVDARRQLQRAMADGPELMPLIRTSFTSEFLLERNLISGVVG